MIYSFFDPDHPERDRASAPSSSSIISAARATAGSPYVYLGYWVDGSARMQYKTRFRPIERLTAAGWQRFDPPEPKPMPRRARAAAVEGTRDRLRSRA